MKRPVIIHMKMLPPNPTPEIRAQFFISHMELLVAHNQDWYLPFGVKKKWYQFFKMEHPMTSYRNDPKIAPWLPAKYKEGWDG